MPSANRVLVLPTLPSPIVARTRVAQPIMRISGDSRELWSIGLARRRVNVERTPPQDHMSGTMDGGDDVCGVA